MNITYKTKKWKKKHIRNSLSQTDTASPHSQHVERKREYEMYTLTIKKTKRVTERERADEIIEKRSSPYCIQ